MSKKEKKQEAGQVAEKTTEKVKEEVKEENKESVMEQETNNVLNEEMLKLEETINSLTEENKVLVEKVKLAQAELINYRKRKDEETANTMKFANQSIIKDLLNVVDNLERTINTTSESEEVKKYQEGVRLIYDNIVSILKGYGVEEINRVGEVFDPSKEQALLTECVEDKDDEIVLEVLLKGYSLKGRVIRPASVKINQK